MRVHIVTESRQRDSTATAAGSESRWTWQPSAPATPKMQSRWQPFRLSAQEDRGSADLWYVLPGFGDNFVIWWNKSLHYYTHIHTCTHTCASSLAYYMRSAAPGAGDKGRDSRCIRSCPRRPPPVRHSSYKVSYNHERYLFRLSKILQRNLPSQVIIWSSLNANE